MKKKFFSVFLSVLTIITQLNLPVNAVAEEGKTSEETASTDKVEKGTTDEDPFTYKLSIRCVH